jgi:heat shock protein HtpX
VYNSYVMWCDQCGWNLQPHQPDGPRNIFESLYASLGQKQSQALFDQLAEADTLKPSLTVSKLLAFVLATIVHGVTIACAIGGIVLLVRGWPGFFAIVGGLLLIGLAWVLRPRFSKSPDGIVSRAEAPALYDLVDTVATLLGTHRISGIVIGPQFNAALERVGWQRARVLCLGLPLWAVLDDQERIALVAHELAHDVNGDPNRGFFVGSAIDSLVNWYTILRPAHIFPPDSGIYGLLAVPANLLLLGLSALAWVGVYVLCHLLWRDSQRAEYLADHLTSTVGGTDASLSLLLKMHLGQTFTVALRRITLGGDSGLDLFQELRRLVSKVPERELERINRVQLMQGSRLDVTHPPTANRINLLRSKLLHQPGMTLARTDTEQLDEELAVFEKEIQKELTDAYAASLHRR